MAKEKAIKRKQNVWKDADVLDVEEEDTIRQGYDFDSDPLHSNPKHNVYKDMLVEVMQSVEHFSKAVGQEDVPEIPTRIWDWWEDCKERKNYLMMITRERKQSLTSRALSKLTKAEIKALGLETDEEDDEDDGSYEKELDDEDLGTHKSMKDRQKRFSEKAGKKKIPKKR